MEVVYDTCDRTTKIRVCSYRNELWLCIDSEGQLRRWTRMFSKSALKHLVDMYGFVDGKGCVNAQRTTTTPGPPVVVESDVTLDALSVEQRNTRGVPQRVHNSGLCWYDSMCLNMLF